MNLAHTATEWIVDHAPRDASGVWQPFHPLYEAVCDEVVENAGAEPNRATLTLVGRRAHELYDINYYDRFRVRTTEADPALWTILFDGVFVNAAPVISGGHSDKGGEDRCTIICYDFKHVINRRNHILGQLCLSQSAYDSYGADWSSWPPTIEPMEADDFCATGLRCIFNENGRPNRCPFTITGATVPDATYPIFGYLGSEYWTVRQMITYVLNEFVCTAVGQGYAPQTDPAQSPGLEDAAFDAVVPHVAVEGLGVLEAADYLAGLVGWEYRLDIFWDAATGMFQLRHVFYRPGAATQRRRSATNPTLLHQMYIPDNYGSLLPTSDTLAGLLADPTINLVWDFKGSFDAAQIANVGRMLGERKIHEITAELTPAWLDSQLAVDWPDADDPLYMSEKDIKEALEAGDALNTVSTYYKDYHASGSGFNAKRVVGRKWALNETGRYADTTYYNRGGPFDLTTVIDGLSADDITYVPRPAVRPISMIDAENAAKVLLEWSVDGGTTWMEFQGRYELLEDEWGVFITQPNLAEITCADASGITDNTYGSGSEKTAYAEVNFWTALFRDREKGYSFADDEWQLKLRLTASIAIDERLIAEEDNISASDIPYRLEGLWDFTQQYKYRQRESNSRYAAAGKNFDVREYDHTASLASHLEEVTELARQRGRSATFTLPTIHLAEGDDPAWWYKRFRVGDAIEGIAGRGISLQTRTGAEGAEFVCIRQIIIAPELESETLITGDTRTSKYK